MDSTYNGWVENKNKRISNFILGFSFGFITNPWYNTKDYRVSSYGIVIKDKRFGWFEDYTLTGEIDNSWSGYYIMGKKVNI